MLLDPERTTDETLTGMTADELREMVRGLEAERAGLRERLSLAEKLARGAANAITASLDEG